MENISAWWTKSYQLCLLMASMSYSLLSGFAGTRDQIKWEKKDAAAFPYHLPAFQALRNLSERSDLKCTLCPETDSVWWGEIGDGLEVVPACLKRNLPFCAGTLQEFQTQFHHACHFKAFSDWSHTWKISNLTKPDMVIGVTQPVWQPPSSGFLLVLRNVSGERAGMCSQYYSEW